MTYPVVMKKINRDGDKVKFMSVSVIYKKHTEHMACRLNENSEEYNCKVDIEKGESDRSYDPRGTIELDKGGGMKEVHIPHDEELRYLDCECKEFKEEDGNRFGENCKCDFENDFEGKLKVRRMFYPDSKEFE